MRPYDDSVSDWMLDLTKSLTVTQLEELARADSHFQLKTLGADFVMEYADYGVFFQHEHQKPQDIVGVSGALALAMADWMQAFALCGLRSITHRVRNPSVVCLSYSVCVAISAVLGSLFYDLGFLDPVDGRCVSYQHDIRSETMNKQQKRGKKRRGKKTRQDRTGQDMTRQDKTDDKTRQTTR